MAKILGLNGSPRKAATYRSVEIALAAAAEMDGITTEMVSLHNLKIRPCNQCDWCKRNQSLCHYDDDMQALYPKIMEADAFIVGSPVYAMSITPQLQAFISRWRPLFHVTKNAVRNKLSAAIAVGGARNGGQELTVSTISHAMQARGLIVVGNESGYYSGAMVWSKDGGASGAEQDEHGMQGARSLGRRLAEIALIMEAGRFRLAEPSN